MKGGQGGGDGRGKEGDTRLSAISGATHRATTESRSRGWNVEPKSSLRNERPSPIPTSPRTSPEPANHQPRLFALAQRRPQQSTTNASAVLVRKCGRSRSAEREVVHRARFNCRRVVPTGAIGASAGYRPLPRSAWRASARIDSAQGTGGLAVADRSSRMCSACPVPKGQPIRFRFRRSNQTRAGLRAHQSGETAAHKPNGGEGPQRVTAPCQRNAPSCRPLARVHRRNSGAGALWVTDGQRAYPMRHGRAWHGMARAWQGTGLHGQSRAWTGHGTGHGQGLPCEPRQTGA